MKICRLMLTFQLFCCFADRVFSSSILWPSGSYGLPMPRSRCPSSNGFYWLSGYLYQDLENNNSLTTVSPNSHLLGWVSNDVVRYFCIKNQTSTALDANRKPWPAGEYCIYKKGSRCPAGMLSGSVLWDDENGANGKNKNANSGLLPTGVYNQDTKIFFCCQTTGWYRRPIELPINKPFYLIALSAFCQEVLNTVHTMEHIVYDTEDDNNSDVQIYPYPYGADSYREPHIYYCYYEACLWTLTALKGTFTSPYYPQNYNNRASCMWHINVPWNYTVSLTFKDFVAERNCCHCDYVEVWENHTNGSANMIGKFCDKTKPDPSEPVRSSTNNVTVVFRSDATLNAKGFAASYEAIPVEGTAVTTSTTTMPIANNSGMASTTTSPQTTSKATTLGANASSKTTSTASSLSSKHSTTTPFPSKIPSRRASSTSDTEVPSQEQTDPESSTTTTDGESVHEARNKNASTGNVYVIVGVMASLIVIGGAVTGAVLCLCRKCRIERNLTGRERIEVSFQTTTEKTVMGISNVSLPDMHQGSDDKDEERYAGINNKLEKVNIIYDEVGDGVNTADKDEVKESENPLYARDGLNTHYKDEVKETENPLYASSDDTVKESDNPMYKSMDDTLKGTIGADIDNPVYERMI